MMLVLRRLLRTLGKRVALEFLFVHCKGTFIRNICFAFIYLFIYLFIFEFCCSILENVNIKRGHHHLLP